MKTVQTENEGLKRAYKLIIGAKEIEALVEKEVRRIAPQIRMPGFRPGKVPPNLIKKMHGEQLQAEALNTAVQEGVQQLLTEEKVRPAMQPEVTLDESYEPGKDAEVRVSLEALPDLPKPNIADLKIERLIVEADEAAVQEQLDRLAGANKSWSDAPKSHKAAAGDRVVMDFVGTIDGEAFDGGSGEGMAVELGSGQLIPGFEDGLAGAKAGDERDVAVTFPDDYPSDRVKGKKASFAVKVTSVQVGKPAKADDDFAKTLGLKDLDQLKGLLRDQQLEEVNGLIRTHMKRQLLDILADRHDFPVPPSMLEAEFANIMQQLRHEASHEEDSKAALAEVEKDSGEYRKIAERRVRLGLLLSEIGAANGVEVSQQEMSRLIGQAASQYQGKERERFLQVIQQNPMAAAQLRAPLYEDKVVDYLFSSAEISERKATRAQLEADLESEEGHVHGPGCGHDHAAPAKGKKPAPSKAEGGKKAAAKPAKAAKATVSPEKPAKGPVEKEADKPVPAKPLKEGPSGKPGSKASAKPAPKAEAKKAPAKKTPAKKK